MATCTSIFQISCLTENMEAAVARLGGNFNAVRANVHSRSDALVRADIDFIVSTADIAPDLRPTVANGFMSRIDVAPRDGRITASEWKAGRPQRATGVPTRRSR